MIRITDDRRKVAGIALGGIWIGGSVDEQRANLAAAGVGAILNVAQDLVCSRGWLHGIEYMQVGLIEGPGNELSAYSAAVLALHALLKRNSTLVCCHGGGRAMAVAIMYLNLTSHRDWDVWIAALCERTELDLPVPIEIHKEAFNRLNWRALSEAIKDTNGC